ncbi:hypothetical protein JS533_000450 [Bifidobacterium amazonense]|uniref:Anti-sigma factor n=1 Tax=Bifidobacterium amazonense TaxID=2809027 RepID=A0ABS9VRL8_9BIFI|nr:hypothetical protein [Bifidobacterium amazonense]
MPTAAVTASATVTTGGPSSVSGISPDALAGAGDPGEPVASVTPAVSDDACFDPNTCCDERERAIIMSLRAYLRPDVAPECLMRRLRETLDHCCCDPDE